MATLKQLERVRSMVQNEPQLAREVLNEIWAADPAIHAVMEPLIDEVENLGQMAAMDIAFALYLLMLYEEARNGKNAKAR